MLLMLMLMSKPASCCFVTFVYCTLNNSSSPNNVLCYDKHLFRYIDNQLEDRPANHRACLHQNLQCNHQSNLHLIHQSNQLIIQVLSRRGYLQCNHQSSLHLFQLHNLLVSHLCNHQLDLRDYLQANQQCSRQ